MGNALDFRVYIPLKLRLRVPSGIWIDRKRWGKKKDINIPNIPGEERNPVLIEAAETRYWVRRIPPLTHDGQQLLSRMQTEIPGLLFFLQQRTLSTWEESRLWFSPRLLATETLRRIIHYNRSKPETEMLSIIRDILEGEKLEEYQFDVSDMVDMLDISGIRVDYPTMRRTLTESWQLRPALPTYTSAIRSPTTG